VLVLAVVSAATAAVPHSRQAAPLRGQASVLDAQAHHALLDLYALDTQLQNTRTQLASLQAQSARLRAQQTLLSQQRSATQRTLQSSRKRLGENLRTLYEQGDSTDALAVMLGAKSLDDAVTTIDDLTRVADQSRQVVATTSAAQIRLDRLRSTIGIRRARLKAAVAAALHTASDLASAQSALLRGDMKAARMLATRAKDRFPVGSPGWGRADDSSNKDPAGTAHSTVVVHPKNPP